MILCNLVLGGGGGGGDYNSEETMKEHQGSGELSSTLEVFCRLVHALLYMAGYYEYTVKPLIVNTPD